MGKKYLDTKQNTIEASILDVWAKSSEEQKAIRNAAKMIAQEQLSKIRGNTPADQGRRAAVEDDIERAENKGDKKEVDKLKEDELDEGPFAPKKVTKKERDSLEDQNEHGLLALKLAQAYGTPNEVQKIKEINKRHENQICSISP